jgi:hypothetical protein
MCVRRAEGQKRRRRVGDDCEDMRYNKKRSTEKYQASLLLLLLLLLLLRCRALPFKLSVAAAAIVVAVVVSAVATTKSVLITQHNFMRHEKENLVYVFYFFW